MEGSTRIEDSNAFLLNCIDKSLKQVSSGMPQVVYWKCEQMKKFPKDQIPNRLEEFVEVLDSLFGDGGLSIKRCIVREIKSNNNFPEADQFTDLLSRSMNSRQGTRKLRSAGMGI
jgi:hypothetical protein